MIMSVLKSFRSMFVSGYVLLQTTRSSSSSSRPKPNFLLRYVFEMKDFHAFCNSRW